MRKSVLAAAAAFSMLSVSSVAVAQSAAPLSLAAAVRAAADTEETSDLRGGFIIPVVIVVGLGILIYVLTKDDDPKSP